MWSPCRSLVVGLIVIVVLLAADWSSAALTTGKCLVSKRKAWAAFRKCQAGEEAKRIATKATDLAKCTTKLQDALAKVDAKATRAAIACRFRDNGDLTVTDFDTGLMWVKKIETIPLLNLPCAALNPPSCVTREFNWFTAMTDFLTELNGHTSDFDALQSGHAGYTDWRLPTIAELITILDFTAPGCDEDATCINPVFGPNAINVYWTSSTEGPSTSAAWQIDFGDGDIQTGNKTSGWRARAVRNGL